MAAIVIRQPFGVEHPKEESSTKLYIDCKLINIIYLPFSYSSSIP